MQLCASTAVALPVVTKSVIFLGNFLCPECLGIEAFEWNDVGSMCPPLFLESSWKPQCE